MSEKSKSLQDALEWANKEIKRKKELPVSNDKFIYIICGIIILIVLIILIVIYYKGKQKNQPSVIDQINVTSNRLPVEIVDYSSSPSMFGNNYQGNISNYNNSFEMGTNGWYY